MRRAVLSVLAVLLVLATAGAALPASAAGGVFTDVKSTTPFASDIEWLAAQGIAQGSPDGRFEPNGAVTRQAMAVFLYKFAHPGTTAPRCTAAAYRDVPKSSPYCGSIAWLADAQITSGTGSGGFSPLAPVTRQAMAAFLYKLESGGTAPPRCTKAPYSDVPKTSPFCGSIDWLYTEGVTTDALGGRFDPRGTVTRGMMAAFLHRYHRARTAPLGVDVSWPQCGNALPADRTFAVVGINRGRPTFFNPCLSSQLTWAAGSSGGTSQPKVQVYVNTANPGLDSTVWPCERVTTTCARQYGRARAQEDVQKVIDAGLDPAEHVWWLDVEDGNSWEATTNGRTRNRAVLEAMVDELTDAGITRIGLYSTAALWKAIVGTVPTSSNLRGRPSWLAGATGIGPARRMCSSAPLTAGGRVELVQFVEDGIDRNHSCH